MPHWLHREFRRWWHAGDAGDANSSTPAAADAAAAAAAADAATPTPPTRCCAVRAAAAPGVGVPVVCPCGPACASSPPV